MTKEQFQTLLKQKILVLDGATGTNLQKAGMPTGVCPEKWILDSSVSFPIGYSCLPVIVRFPATYAR